MSETAEVQARRLLENADFVRRVARALVRNPSDAEDVAQETCLAALRGGPRQPEALRSWLRSTARNIAAKLHRSRQRSLSRERGLPAPEPAENTDAIVERLQMQRQVVDAVLELSEPCRTTLLLRYYEDLGPRQIALRQQVPLDTVRARLRRGLQRLRARLDAGHDGDRSAWCAALIPLTELGGAIAAGASSAAITTGLLGLLTKTSSWAAALLLLGTLLGAYWLVSDQAQQAETTALDANAGTARGAKAFDPDGPAEAYAADFDDPVGGTQRLQVLDPLSARNAAPVGKPGRVLFRPFDAVSGAPAPGVSVRYLSEDRFAELGQVEGTADALLSAGSYRAALTAPGFEPRQLGPFTVRAGRTVDLGYVALNRGFGSISGTVLAPAHPPGTELTVELLGRGRHPCREAEALLSRQRRSDPEAAAPSSLWTRKQPCPLCGFSAGGSRFQLGSGDRFEFNGLASGPYLLRAFLGRPHPASTSRQLALSPGGRLHHELTLSRTVQMTFELRDPDDQPVTGLFETDQGTVVHSVKFLLLEGTRVRAEAPVGPTYSGLTVGARLDALKMKLTFWNTLLETTETEDSIVAPFDPVEQQPLDRARQEDDVLFARLAAPRQNPDRLPARMEGPGRFIVDSVPAERLDIVVHGGPLISDRISLDLRAYNGRVIWLKLHQNDEPTEEEELELAEWVPILGNLEISLSPVLGIGHQGITVGRDTTVIITEDQ